MTAARRSPVGRWERSLEGYEAFLPADLPRDVDLDASLVYALDNASRAVSVLAGIGETLPNPHLLIRPFLRREAVLSSKIEGTQASLSDLFLHEASGERRDPGGDVREVANYVAALEHGLQRLQDIPLSIRLMNEMHARLLEGVRGEDKRPGELRNSQVRGERGTGVEEARFVPPPASTVPDLLADLERFLNDDIRIPPLVQAALMHYQFEAIHPYTDGNGRIGRLLIVLFLCAGGILRTPLLYLSAYFERLRDEYYDQLLRVSTTGEWDPWLRFFLRGVELQARDAAARARRVRGLQENYRARLQGIRSGNAHRLLDEILMSPFFTAQRAARLLEVTLPAARRLLERFVALGILVEDRTVRPRRYVARELLWEIERPIAQEQAEQLPLLQT